jgi:hypothetical protein
MMHCLNFSARRYIFHMYLLFLFRFFLCHGDFSSYFSFASFFVNIFSFLSSLQAIKSLKRGFSNFCSGSDVWTEV